MHDLKDLTILIAVKIDSADRLANLDIVVPYLQCHINSRIIISEQGDTSQIQGRYSCDWAWNPTRQFFNRQEGVNLAAKMARTPYIAHWDADILLIPDQIIKSVCLLRDGKADVVYPYNGRFYNVPKSMHPLIKSTNDLHKVDVSACQFITDQSVGGAVFFNRDIFWKAGGANEKFLGLGYEDNEIFSRFKKLNYNMVRVAGPLLHLDHERKETAYELNPYIGSNKTEYERIHNMSKEQLLQEVSTWNYYSQ